MSSKSSVGIAAIKYALLQCTHSYPAKHMLVCYHAATLFCVATSDTHASDLKCVLLC